MEDLHKVGGTPAGLKDLLEAGMIHGGCMARQFIKNTTHGSNISPNRSCIPTFRRFSTSTLPEVIWATLYGEGP
jgi:dihydroxyacid dehydratase/phosphogluconate dehydratase